MSEDNKTNTYSNKLIHICSNSNLVVLNGQKLGDTAGKHTSHLYNDSSTVDLGICNYDGYSKIKSFEVLNPVWYLDHCPIVAHVYTHTIRKYYTKNDQTSTENLPQHFICVRIVRLSPV